MRPLPLYDPTPVNCHPSRLLEQCAACARYRPGPAPGGKTTVIDGTQVLHGGVCPMWFRRKQ